MMNSFNKQELKILDERAKLLAKETKERKISKSSEILVFNLDEDRKYAVGYQHLEKVLIEQKVTKMAGVNPVFLGLFYHNSEFWPVINAKELFLKGCEQCIDCENVNIILIRNKGQSLAVCVDEILGQVAFYEDKEEKNKGQEKAVVKSYVKSIYQNDIAVIDTELLLNSLTSIPVTMV